MSPGAPGAREAGRGRKEPPLEPLEGAQSCLDLRGPAPPGSQWPSPAWISAALPWLDLSGPAPVDLSGPALPGSQGS